MTSTNSVTVTVKAADGATKTVPVSINYNSSSTPPPLGHMLFGACTNGAAGIPTAEKTLGKLEANRVFFSGSLPSSYAALNMPQGVTVFVSYKGPSSNTVPFVNSCPAGTRIIFHHEPENDYGGNGAAFVNQFVGEYDTIKSASNGKNVLVGNVAMTYQYGPGRFGTNGSYLVPANKVDFYGADNYENKPGGGGLKNDPLFQAWYKLVKDRGKPLSLCEYGVGVNPVGYTVDQWSAKRAETMANDKVYLANIGGFDSVLYWYFTGAQGDWRFYDQASSAAWKSLAT